MKCLFAEITHAPVVFGITGNGLVHGKKMS